MDTKSTPQFHLGLLHPRYWRTWLLLGLWALVAQLPYRLQLWLARQMGRLAQRFATARRLIAQRNIELCFPELTASQRQAMVKANFAATAMAFFETGIAWFWPRWRLKRLFHYRDLARLQEQQAAGQGVLLLSLHFTTLELWGAALCPHLPVMDMTYRPHRNPVYDFVQHRQRGRHNPGSRVVAAGDVRSVVRALKQGRIVAYFPDQDYGPKHSVFAPFFGIEAATVTALSRMAKLAGVPVIPVMGQRLPAAQGYQIQVLPAWNDFPSGDDRADAERLNRHVEACIRQCPEQYLWVHRRFKTRPPGEPSLYTHAKKKRRLARPQS